MNIALILAGGSGTRTAQDIPKQFMNLYDKPLIIYTLENFQNHPDIDGIVVVCLEGWHEVLKAYAGQYGIDKLKKIVSGGVDGQESTQKGLEALRDICTPEDVVLVHDGIRPFITEEVIADAITKCKQKGSGLSSVRCQETIVRTDDGVSGEENIDRKEVMRVQTPQAYKYGRAMWAYEEAERRGIKGEVYINTLMLHLGEKLYFSKGTERNVKITTVDDLELFKALLKMERDSWVK